MHKKIMLLIASLSLNMRANEMPEALKNKEITKVQIVFDVEKKADIDPEVWQSIVNIMLELYKPELSDADEIDLWIQSFAQVIKKIAAISTLTQKTHGSLTCRFITD